MVGFPLLCLSHWKIQHFDGIYKERGGGLYMAIGYVSLPESKLTNDVSQLLSSDPCEPCWLVGFLRSSTKSLKAHMSPEKKKKNMFPPKKRDHCKKNVFHLPTIENLRVYVSFSGEYHLANTWFKSICFKGVVWKHCIAWILGALWEMLRFQVHLTFKLWRRYANTFGCVDIS